MTFTLIIIVITALISIAGFSNEDVINRLILWPRKMDNPAEYYRLLTSGFIHADWNHLAFNMFTLYFFGIIAEQTIPVEKYALLYLSGIVIASLPSFLKNRNNNHYRSMGASGGVAALVFFTIYFYPWSKMGIIFIPVHIPAIIFGGLYLLYEIVMSKRGYGNINHDAHIWGSVYGLFFAFLIDPTHGQSFIDNIVHPLF